MTRTSSLAGTALLLTLLTVLAACEREAAPPPAPGPVPVTVVTLEERPVTLTRQLAGRTNAYLIAEIRPQVGGIIQDRLFEEGGEVEAGQPLYQLDPAIYRAELASAEAGLARAEAALESARTTASRLQRLIDTNAVSRQEYDEGQAALRTAEAEVGVAQAAVQRARIELAYAQIRSPIAGRVGRSTVTQGALVTANQPQALTTVRQLDPIYVDLNMSASELLELRRQVAAGEASRAEVPVTILLDDGSRYPHQGRLTFADPTVDPGTGSFLLRVVVPNPEVLLLPGMYVRAEVSLIERQRVVLAPQRAITRNPQGEATALVVTEENTVELRPVRVSRTVGDQWLVEEGLAAGERVIVAGVQKVQPGVTVEPSEAEAAPDSPPPAGGN